jgi:hypothetical protein
MCVCIEWREREREHRAMSSLLQTHSSNPPPCVFPPFFWYYYILMRPVYLVCAQGPSPDDVVSLLLSPVMMRVLHPHRGAS